MALFHYNIATDGIRAGHKILSVLGLKWLSVDIIVPPVPKDRPGGGGAGRHHDIFSTAKPEEYYNIRVTIKFNGKTIVKFYKTKFADVIARIIVSVDTSVITPVSIFAKMLSNEIITKLVKVSNYNIKEDIDTVQVTVEEIKEPIIKVKRKE